MRKTIAYISLILIFVCLPAKTRGQYVKKESMAQVTNAVILYSEGAFSGGIWPLGQSLYDNNTSATIRHTVNEGNGSNINVNSKLSFRILIAPTDLSDTSWAGAMGFSDEANNNLAAAANSSKQSGCATYTVPEGSNFPGYAGIKTGWRLPTQRELQLMWLLRDAIDQAFLPKYPKRDKLLGDYWSSTEWSANMAFHFNFSSPWCAPIGKEVVHKVRCVRDY